MEHVRNPELPWPAVEYADGVTVYYPLGPWGQGWEGKATRMYWAWLFDFLALAASFVLCVWLHSVAAEWIAWTAPILFILLFIGWVCPLLFGLRLSRRRISMRDWDDLQSVRTPMPLWLDVLAWLGISAMYGHMYFLSNNDPILFLLWPGLALVAIPRRLLSHRRLANGTTNLARYFPAPKRLIC